ncbi:hypothetical protein ASZ97_08015 [Brucella melitensis]|nr:hypothetical protein BM28_A1682 [Brucella melitensis M28]ADZ87615.1 hypothetical protein BM590_A1670 [Brucella melitensis M5-90]AOG50295.1 hypothetical protein BFL33_07965 [Brucella melitensis]AOG53280.1 hypothetical protein BFS11_07970 [Brucella melitensis]KKO96245.1 hypothetical protein VT70_00190 [Brucella melitensis]
MPLNQCCAVVVFLCGHLLENLRRLRKLVAQAIGISQIDAGIILLGGYGKRQNFLFRKRIERASVITEESAEHILNPLI